MEAQNRSMIYKLLIYSKQNQAILAETDLGKVYLPSFVPEIIHSGITRHIHEFIEKTYNIKTNVLRCLEDQGGFRTYEIEVLEDNGGSALPDLIWVRISNRKLIDECSHSDKEIINNWLSASGYPEIPWFNYGWIKEMETWIRQVLPFESVTVQQIRSWERATLFKIHTEQGNYYFKAVPDIFFHEPLISEYLSQTHPSSVPNIIQVDADKGWYIMKELKGPLLGSSGSVDYWKDALVKLGDIQKHSVAHRKQLETFTPARPVPCIIKKHLEKSLNTLVINRDIDTDIYKKLQSSIPCIMDKVSFLKESDFPAALEHGDFFGGNIIVEDHKSVIYDWSDCSLSHPFLSAVVFLEEVEHFFTKDVSLSLRNDYLAIWTGIRSKEALIKEYEAVKAVAAVFGLAVYQTYIFPSFTENRDKKQIIEGYVKSWMKQFRIN